MKSLILSQSTDPHACAVSACLSELGVEHTIAVYERLSASNFCFQFGDHAGGLLILEDGTVLDLSTYDSIWHRRPGNLQSGNFPFPWVKQYVDNEMRAAFHGTIESLDCLWVNHPSHDRQCAYKLNQLKTASRVGLKTPNTLVTNDPDKVLEFYEIHDRSVIYKLIGEGSAFALPAYEIPAGIPTLPMREVDLQNLEQVRLGPHLFQQRITKTHDIRTTIIGKKIFSVRIDSQLGKASLDWRQDYSVPMTVCELPDEVSEACLRLMLDLGLNYGALDFCVTPEGEHYFLEVNCAGQYMWLEKCTDLKLSKELALLLAGKSEPMVARRSSTSMV